VTSFHGKNNISKGTGMYPVLFLSAIHPTMQGAASLVTLSGYYDDKVIVGDISAEMQYLLL
jgi:hypothetical protein